MRVAYATLLPPKSQMREAFLRAPLAAGYLCAYADFHRRGRDAHDIVGPTELSTLRDLDAVAARILCTDPDIIALSVYVWNHAEIAAVCRNVRASKPCVRIVLGGPEVCFAPQEALGEFDADWVCTGEGEIPFLNLLNTLECDPLCRSSLPGLVHRSAVHTASAAPSHVVSPLDAIPSPYLAGLLEIRSDTFIDLETTRGCPYKCAYCVYGKALPSVRRFSLRRVEADVRHVVDRGATGIYLMDPVFNYPRERCNEVCRLIADLNTDRAIEFWVEARAELVDEDSAEGLARAGVTSVEIGLQSTSRETLRLIRRGFVTSKFTRGCLRLYECGIHADIGMIVGLPGDDEGSIRRTADFVVSNRLGELNVYRLQVLPGSQLRRASRELGIEYCCAPPYYVRSTATLREEQIISLVQDLEKLACAANRSYNRGVKTVLKGRRRAAEEQCAPVPLPGR